MTGFIVGVAIIGAAAPLAAQTPEQVAAEPIVKLQPGETPVEGECLTQQELDLIDALNSLRRPTVGVEGDGDDPLPFDPHYLVGEWSIEGVLPESPLAPAGEFVGTGDGGTCRGVHLPIHYRGDQSRIKRPRSKRSPCTTGGRATWCASRTTAAAFGS